MDQDDDDDDDGKQLTTVKSGSMCTTCWDMFFQIEIKHTKYALKMYMRKLVVLVRRWVMNRIFCIFLLFLDISSMYVWETCKQSKYTYIFVIFLGGITCFVFSRFSTSSSSISMLLFFLLSPHVLRMRMKNRYQKWQLSNVLDPSEIRSRRFRPSFLIQVLNSHVRHTHTHTTRKWIRVYHYSSMSKWMIHWKVLYRK